MMIDTVLFDFRMPDGFQVSEAEPYQSVDLKCNMNVYVIEAGRLVRAFVDGGSAGGDMNFCGMLNICTSSTPSNLSKGWHEYDLEFVNGSLKVIHCKQTGASVRYG